MNKEKKESKIELRRKRCELTNALSEDHHIIDLLIYAINALPGEKK